MILDVTVVLVVLVNVILDALVDAKEIVGKSVHQDAPMVVMVVVLAVQVVVLEVVMVVEIVVVLCVPLVAVVLVGRYVTVVVLEDVK